ncbi:elongation of very long chain fatty acids protein-like [Homalodisca vitripennis]|uniref:elongation of very long chain fatty acids protein-like n=1 Tax=Homalodisca vitripennis TaxID=197043 RepID=UPI001EEC98A4|nr:elongation of very long chain fatty acids protein-like [Homalodisca vitripennis]
MVLKKNKHQVSFLHLYHHVMMAVATWLCVKYMPGGHVAFFGTINAFVHVVMYFYYFLTSYDVSYKKSIWWKRHITEIQLIQFIVLVAQQGYAIISPSCDYPKYLLIFFLIQAVLMIYLFSDFYLKAYVMKNKAKKNVMIVTLGWNFSHLAFTIGPYKQMVLHTNTILHPPSVLVMEDCNALRHSSPPAHLPTQLATSKT